MSVKGQSFTWGSDESMQALVDSFQTHLDTDAWYLIPNLSNFKTLISALRFTAEADNNPLQSEAAAELLSSIAESLGIEFI